MSTTNIYIGLNDKDSHKQKHSNLIYKDIIIECFMDYGIENLSIQLIDGIYKHLDGTIVSENTFKITLCNYEDEYNLRNLVNTLKLELNQECIMVEKIQSLVQFI